MYCTNCEDEGRVAIWKNREMSEQSKDCGRARTDSADIIHTQNCTIYQLRLPGKFSPLDPGALLSESSSVLRGSSRAAIIPTTIWRLLPSLPPIRDIWSNLVNAWPNFVKLILSGKVSQKERISRSYLAKVGKHIVCHKKERVAPNDACIHLWASSWTTDQRHDKNGWIEKVTRSHYLLLRKRCILFHRFHEIQNKRSCIASEYFFWLLPFQTHGPKHRKK